jgi:hypothetical protein
MRLSVAWRMVSCPASTAAMARIMGARRWCWSTSFNAAGAVATPSATPSSPCHLDPHTLHSGASKVNTTLSLRHALQPLPPRSAHSPLRRLQGEYNWTRTESCSQRVDQHLPAEGDVEGREKETRTDPVSLTTPFGRRG